MLTHFRHAADALMAKWDVLSIFFVLSYRPDVVVLLLPNLRRNASTAFHI